MASAVLRSIVALWERQIELAKKAKKRHFDDTAQRAWDFMGKSYRQLYIERKADDEHERFPTPYYKMRRNLAAEYVAVLLPFIHAKVPNRVCESRRPQPPPELVELIGATTPPELIVQEQMLAWMMQWYLNWVPKEYDLAREARTALPEGLVKGRCLVWHHMEQSPFGIMPVSNYDTVDGLLIDPDTEQLRDAAYIIRIRNRSAWKLAREFSIPVEKIRGARKSYHRQAVETAFEVDDASDEEKSKLDVVEYYEVYSRMGIGVRLHDTEEVLKEHTDALESLGPYVRLVIIPGIDHPANIPAEILSDPSGAAELKARLEWPIPFHQGFDPWPMTCHDEKTEVLTDSGWKRFARLSGNELLATVNLETDTIEYQKPTRIIDKPYSGDMVRFRGRQKLDMLVTPDHRMVYYSPKIKTPQIKKASDLVKSDHLKLTARNWVGKEPDLPDFLKGIDVEAFAAWLGFYIAEGCCAGRKTCKNGPCSWQVTITQFKPDGRLYYEHLIEHLPFHHHPYRERTGSYTISSKDLWQYLKPLGKSYEKYVPQWIKDASQTIISSFLRGYMMGDGNCFERGNCQLNSYTSSKQLADDIQELWLKVGLTAGVKPIPPFTNENGPCGYPITSRGGFLVSARYRSKASLQNPKKHTTLYHTEPDYSGRVYCASVPNGTLITRRNGQPVVSGNCLDFYPNARNPWAQSPLEGCMPLLVFVDHLYSFLMGRIRTTCRDIYVTSTQLQEALQNALVSGHDHEVVPWDGEPGIDLQKLIHVIKGQELNPDTWRLIPLIESAFERSSGMTALLYGADAGRQMRSAAEADIREGHATSRPNDFADMVEDWNSRIAGKEAIATRLFVPPPSNLFGEQPMDEQFTNAPLSQAWAQLVSVDGDPVLAAGQLRYTVEAGSGRRKNKQARIADAQQITQSFLLPLLQLASMPGGNADPYNALVDMMAEMYELPMSRLHLQSMPAPQPVGPTEPAMEQPQ